MAKRLKPEPSVPGNQTSGLSEEVKECVSEGRVGPAQNCDCAPHLPTEEISECTLRPGHLDELTSLAKNCLEAVASVRRRAGRSGKTDDDRWWIEFSLVNAMTTALRAARLLSAGLEEEILLAYPSSVAFAAAGLTCGNAHRLATAVAIDLVCRAWNVVYVSEGCTSIGPEMIFTFRRPLVRMEPSDKGGFPLFKPECVLAVADAILTYPAFDEQEIEARIGWENAKVRECRTRVAGSPTVQANAGIPGAKEDAGAPARQAPPDLLPDGPTPPDAFCWKGQQFAGLAPVPWRLVNTLWEAENHTLGVEDLAEPVWRDREAFLDGGPVGSARRSANAFFHEHAIPYRVSKKGQFLRLKEQSLK